MFWTFAVGVALSLAAPAPPASGSVLELLDGRIRVHIPPGYVRKQSPDSKPGVIFTRSGDWAAALAKALPNAEYDSLFLSDWFHDDVIDFVKISAVAINDRRDIEASPREIHERFAKGFHSRWGEHSFSIFDDATGIGWCVNYAGAFVAGATRKVEDTLIVVEAMDNVEVLVAEKGGLPQGGGQASPEALWNYFERAANSSTVSAILRSAQRIK